MTFEPGKPGQYPPNIQAIIKRKAPAAEILGQTILEVDRASGWVRVAYYAVAEHENRFGAIHGGITAAMLDDAISLAAGLIAEWGEITPTLEMKVCYLSRAKPGMELIADARILRRGRQIQFLEATLKDSADETLIATATATVLLAPLKP